MKRVNWKLLLLTLLVLILHQLVPPLYPDACLAIAPAIGAAAIIGASGILSSILGAGSQSSVNKTNMEIAQMNNEFNRVEAQKTRDWQESMWNKENAYNTASAQRDRLSEAGLNPYLMMNGGSAGVASSAGSASPATAAPPPEINPLDFSGLGETAASAVNAYNQTNQTNAQAAALQSQKDYYKALADQTWSNIDWGKLTPDYKNWMRTTGTLRARLAYDTDKQNLANLRWTAMIQEAQHTNLLLDNESRRTLNKYLDQSEQLRLHMMSSQMFALHAQGRLSLQQIKESITKQILMQAQGDWFNAGRENIEVQTQKGRIDYMTARKLADNYVESMNAMYIANGNYWSGYNTGSFEAGKGDAEGKKYQGKQQKWNYQKRWFDAGLQTIGTVGNAVGNIKPW